MNASRLTAILNWLNHYKYLIVIVVGVLIVGFFDDNSLLRRVKLQLQISKIEDEIDAFNKKNEAEKKELNELKRNPKAIEKIAREQYFMKADDEDIFVLSDDEQDNQTNQSNETDE
ncbi:MAG: septum formation initiator family protein [Prevotella sp.]|nr:septum formation initiator family protein [Prevotella sp.]